MHLPVRRHHYHCCYCCCYGGGRAISRFSTLSFSFTHYYSAAAAFATTVRKSSRSIVNLLGFPITQGVEAFLLGTGATIVGYMFYGGFSFGLTEFLKRRFVELAGPDLAALYPIPILLGARCACRAGAKCRVEVCRGVGGSGEGGSAGVAASIPADVPERMLGLVPAWNHSCWLLSVCSRVLLVSRACCVDAPASVVAVAVAACCCCCCWCCRSAVSACFAATAVTPFETLRIKTVTVPNFPKTLVGAMSEMVTTGRAGDLVAGASDEK